MRSKLQDLSKILEREVKKAEKFSEETKKAAAELGRAAASSWSVAGDRIHAEGHAEISQEKLAKLQKLLEEVRNSLNKSISNKVEPVCFIKVAHEGNQEEEFYVVSTPVFLTEAKLLSTQSPFGQELLGKKVGDITSRGKIISIE